MGSAVRRLGVWVISVTAMMAAGASGAAATTWKLVQAGCNRNGNQGEVQRGLACWDQKATDESTWSVDEGSATWTEPSYKVDFTYTMPGFIDSSGGSAQLSVTADDVSNNSGINQRVCVFASTSQFEPQGDQDVCATAFAKTPGSSDTGKATVTFLPKFAPAGTQQEIPVSLGDGGNLYFLYEAQGVPSSEPTVDSTPGPASTAASGATVVVDPGITESCPSGGASCNASETATTQAVGRAREARSKTLVIGRGHTTIAAGKTVKLTFKLNAGGAKLLRKLRHLTVKVKVVSRVDHQSPVTTTKTITIEAPKRKH